MELTTWLLLFGTCTHVVFGKTMLCYNCHHIKDPNACNLIKACHADEICVTEVHEVGPGDHEFTLRCGQYHDRCYTRTGDVMVGKRQPGHEHGPGHDPGHHGPHNLRCEKCCDHHGLCNRELCSLYQPALPTTTTVQPIVSTKPPVYDPTCRNHEEDGFSCAAFDLFHFCTDPASFAYVLAHEKCKAHCGICTLGPGSHPVPNAPVTSPPAGVCTDYEQDGLQCAGFDIFHFCNDSASIAYVVAHEKCRKHCGFCTHNSGVTVSSTATPAQITQTVASTTVIQQTTNAASTSTTTIATQSTTADTLFTATASVTCTDMEANGFSCTYMDTFNICTTSDPVMVTIRNEKCRKHCGICT